MYARTAPNVCEIAYTYLMVRLAVPLFREERQTSHAVLARTVWSHRGCIGLLADVGKVGDRHSLVWEGDVDCELDAAH